MILLHYPVPLNHFAHVGHVASSKWIRQLWSRIEMKTSTAIKNPELCIPRDRVFSEGDIYALVRKKKSKHKQIEMKKDYGVKRSFIN